MAIEDLPESDLRAALDRISDGFFTLDHSWRYTYLNRGVEDYLGRPREELLGRVVWEVFPEIVGTEIETVYRRAAAGTAPVELELFGPVRRRWTAVRLFPTDEGLAVSFRDITEQRESLDALRDSEARFRAVFEHSLDASFLTAPTGEILAANPAACRLFQRTEAELCAIGRAGVVDARDPRLAAIVEERRRTGHVSGEMTMVRKDGTTFEAEMSSAVFVDRLGRERTSLSIRDLTERKRQEAALRLLTEAGRLLPSSLDLDTTRENLGKLVVPSFAIAVVVVLLDDAGLVRILQVGDTAGRAPPGPAHFPRLPQPREHGVSRVIHTGLPELVPVVTDEWLREIALDDTHLAEARALGVASAVVVPMVVRGTTIGALSFVRRASEPRYDAADLELARGIADRTALAFDNARLYAEAVRARLRRDEMLGMVSHDLRSPLNAIQLNAELLRRRAPAKEVDVIRAAVARADRLVQDLLAIAAIDAGSLPLDRRPQPIRPIIDEIVDLYRAVGDSRSITFEIADEAPPTPVVVDRHRLVQALSNLVGNALKYAPPGSTVAIRTRASDGGVAIDVSDRGPGIPAEQLPHLFDRFWQGRPAAHGGVGLGLAIARGIVEAHGGRLHVTSTPGAGATFTIELAARP